MEPYVRTSSCLRPILFLLHAGTTLLKKLKEASEEALTIFYNRQTKTFSS